MQKCAQSLVQQLIGAVEELEATMGSEHVTTSRALLPLFTDDVRYAAKLKKLPWKQITRKSNDDVQLKNADVL